MRRRRYLIVGGMVVTSLVGCGSPGPGVNVTDGSPNAPSPGGVGGDGTDTAMGNGTETPAGTETTKVGDSIEMVAEGGSFYFDPIGMFVDTGTTVEWTVASGAHSTTAYEDRIPEDADAWDSGILASTDSDNRTFSATFDVTGTYDYYCTPHQAQGMVARLIVGEPGGPAEGSMPPDGTVPDSQRIVEEGSVTFGEFSRAANRRDAPGVRI